MFILRLFLLGLFTGSESLTNANSEDFKKKCDSFQPKIDSTTLEFTEFLKSGSKASLRYRDPSCGGPGYSAALTGDVCRVALYIKTSERSAVHFEAWLPGTWNGRFLATGNGGIGGC
jgi:feruloyl esterase